MNSETATSYRELYIKQTRTMGFKNFWTFINETDEGSKSGEQIDFDWRSNDKGGTKPWIVVDYNNVVMGIVESNGCDMVLLQEYLTNFFRALASCMARICVINDGRFHSEERAVIKLGRMHNDIAKRMRSENVTIDSEVASNIATSIFKRTFVEHYGVNACTDLNNESTEVMYIYHVADGEADPAIRSFTRSKLEKGHTVYLMSQDASLVLGLNPEKNIFVVGLDSLSVVRSRSGDNILKGKIYRLQTVLTKLGECATSQNINSTSVTGDMLLYVAALLDSETADLRRGQYESPYPLLRYIGNFLEERRVKNKFGNSEETKAYNIREKLNQLYTAVTIIRAWKSTGDNDFNNFIQTIFQHASQAAESNEARPLYGLQSWSQSSLRNDANYLLWKTERNVTNPPKEGRGGIEVEYGGYLYSASYDRRRQIVKFSEINVVRDNCPGGFANRLVRKAVYDEVKKRIQCSLDQVEDICNNHKTEWRIAAQFEVDGESTEALTSPMKTLVTQIKNVYKAHLQNSASSTSSSNLPQDLHTTMGNLKISSNSVPVPVSASAPVPANKIICIRTRSIPTPPSHSSLKGYSDKDLLNKHVRVGLVLPLEGYISGSYTISTAPTVLQFYTVRDGVIDNRDICNKADYRYSIDSKKKSSNLGTLLDLDHRAHYLNQLSSCRLGLSNKNQPEEAVSRIFESLGLSCRIDVRDAKEYVTPDFGRLVAEACMAIADCWRLLPCTKETRLNLMPRHPSVDTARVLYATVYVFSSILCESQSRKGGITRETLIRRVATALIVCPLFSIHSSTGCPAHDMFLDGNIQFPKPECHSSRKEFSTQLKEYNNQFIVRGASINCKRNVSLVDYTLSSVLDLLGYADTPECEGKWIDHCLWYNLCGVQHIMGYMEVHGPESIMNAAMNAQKNSDELIRFINSSVAAVDAVVRSLQ